MCTVVRRILAAVALVAIAGNAAAQLGGQITAIEKSQLPKFCWKQMEVPNAVGPAYSFPADCGPGMNHYCGGLVRLMRAKHASGKERMSLLGSAAGDIGYTQQWMKGYPNCSIRGHVDASRTEVDSLLRIYGGTPPKTPGTPK